MIRQFYAAIYPYGKVMDEDGHWIRHVYTFESMSERDEWADASFATPDKSGYREAIPRPCSRELRDAIQFEVWT